MAIAFVQIATAVSADHVVIAGVAGGSLLVWSGSSGSPVTALSDDTGDIWAEVPNSQDTPGALESTSQWYLMNATAGTHTVTRTGGFPSFESYAIAEYSGVALTNALDQQTSAQNTIGPPSSGATPTTTQADELLVGAIGNESSIDNSGWINSFTPRVSLHSISRALDVGDRIVSATGTYTASANSGGTQTWQCLIATFKAAAGAGQKTFLLH